MELIALKLKIIIFIVTGAFNKLINFINLFKPYASKVSILDNVKLARLFKFNIMTLIIIEV
jgi:hypothetical protein